MKVRTLTQHAGEVAAVRFLGGNVYDHIVATADAGQLVRLWDLRVPRMVEALPCPAQEHLPLAVHAPSHLLTAGTESCKVTAWDLRVLRRLQGTDLRARVPRFVGEVTSLSFSPTGSYLTAGSSTGQVAALDFQQQQWQLICEREDAVHGLAWGWWPPSRMPFVT